MIITIKIKNLFKTIVTIVITYIAISLTIVAVTHAKESQYKILFATGEYPPYISKTLERYGVVSQIMDEACNRAGIRCEYKFFPWKRVENLVKHGKYIATFCWSKTLEREKVFLFSEYHVQHAPNAIFYKKSRFPKGIKFYNYSDLAQYKIVGISTFWYQETFKKLGIKAHYVPNAQSAWGALGVDRAEVFIALLYVGLSGAKKNIPDMIDDIGYTIKGKEDPYAYGYIMYSRVHKDTKWVKAKLDKAIESIHKDGTFAKLFGSLL